MVLFFRALIDCSYVGNFNIPHDTPKKRRMTNGIKKKCIDSLINKGKSFEYFREEEALGLMKKGKRIKCIIEYFYSHTSISLTIFN